MNKKNQSKIIIIIIIIINEKNILQFIENFEDIMNITLITFLVMATIPDYTHPVDRLSVEYAQFRSVHHRLLNQYLNANSRWMLEI